MSALMSGALPASSGFALKHSLRDAGTCFTRLSRPGHPTLSKSSLPSPEHGCPSATTSSLYPTRFHPGSREDFSALVATDLAEVTRVPHCDDSLKSMRS